MNGQYAKSGAVWWRVSTDDQREISPETQIKEALILAAEEGFQVPDDYVLGTDWHSLSVWNSPAMERLKDLIRSRMVQAVFMYDPDRGPSKPAHRLLLRALCEEQGVIIRCRHGQVPEGDMGEVMEFLSAWSKEKQVHRAQQGARDGLRDRARLRGLPTTSHAAYGYRWNGRRFEPAPSTFPVAGRIWQMALEGVSLRRIARLLTEASVPSPSGKLHWSASTIAKILSNPVYSGAYVALRTQAVEPKVRRGQTYGKTSSRRTDEQDQCPIPGLVEEPVVTPEEYARVQERLARNKAEGGKVTQFYLMRGMLRCEQCGQRWRSKIQRRGSRVYYRYLCSGAEGSDKGVTCDSKSVNGPVIETRVWDRIVAFLSNPDLFLSAVEGQEHTQQEAIEKVQASIKRLERRLAKLLDAEAKAYSGYARDITSEETYQRVSAELRAERSWITEELERQQGTLEEARRRLVSADTIRDLYPHLKDRIQNATPEDKRFILECLDTQVTVGPSGVSLSLAIPEQAVSAVSTQPRAGPGPPTGRGWAE